MHQYEKRVVLFLDLLGFKELLNKFAPVKIYNILNGILPLIKNKPNSKEITQFSDSIVISFVEDDAEEIFELFDEVQKIIRYLIEHGIICRGAISYGDLIHKGNILFGPALVKAYETETKASIYPRVIIDDSIPDIGEKAKTYYGEEITNEEILKFLTKYKLEKDFDGKYYIDFFKMVIIGMDANQKKEATEYLKNLSEIIKNGIEIEKADIKIKYGWLQNKYNSMIDSFESIGLFNYPSILENKEAEEYLKKIK